MKKEEESEELSFGQEDDEPGESNTGATGLGLRRGGKKRILVLEIKNRQKREGEKKRHLIPRTPR